ncbi:hypothetical protein N7510_004903 [Penicillium lagena]|uniref:uncharacterized protein n=1 Tax=Penicillium lagena TaxID=94218 RepID=UPI00253FB26B|nr:uncharacterized protein N7510_004903 [Penicillium lagena]KAJ5620919.1 hypothetical protein N7510_004903 [Penicillium lagena]
MNAASQGEKALSESNCPLAIQHYTRALTELPRAPPYYLQRSTAYSRLKPADGGPDSKSALHDAEIALVLARDRGKRELILAAQMRRGVALYQLERFGDAAFVFGIVEGKTKTEEEKDKSEGIKAAMSGAGGKKNAFAELPIWMAKVRRKLNELGEGHEQTIVSVPEFPGDVRVPSEKELKAQWEALRAGKSVQQTAGGGGAPTTVSNDPGSSLEPAATEPSKPSSGPTSPQKVRHEWYQSQDSVVVTLYVKGIAKESVEVELKDDSASLQFPLPSGADYAFTLDPLYARIDPSTSKVSVMSTKIEITLRKQVAGQKWNALEGSTSISTTTLADRPAAAAPSTSSGPAYPTSSRHGAKDWDKVASSLTAKKPKDKKKKAADEEGNGEDDVSDAESADSELGGDAVDGFFKKLYAGADPDTRRAMMKSYVESQGTSLSTNWQEVAKGKVEPHPPS